MDLELDDHLRGEIAVEVVNDLGRFPASHDSPFLARSDRANRGQAEGGLDAARIFAAAHSSAFGHVGPESFDVAEHQNVSVILGKLVDRRVNLVAGFLPSEDRCRRMLPRRRRVDVMAVVVKLRQEVVDRRLRLAAAPRVS